ncbi:MAG: amidohydrolase family protein [Acidobacteriaceae bacterium]
MPTTHHLRNCGTLLLGLALLTAAHAQSVPSTVLHCPNLIDAANGKLLGATTVVIEGDRIKEVVPGSASRPGATVIELPGETCMPGLIDMHVHITLEYTPTFFMDEFTLNPSDVAIRSTVYAKRTLLAGFTTIRNLGDWNYESVALRNQINSGYVEGPRIFTAGQMIGTTGGHADPTNGLRHDLMGDRGPAQSIINGSDDAWKAVRQHYKEGADVIKIMTSGGVLDLGASADNSQMTQEEINAIVAAAKDYGFTVAVHAHGAEGIRRAVIGGVDSIEHGTFMDDQDMQLMKEHGTFLVPTLYTGQYVAERARIPGAYAPQVAAKALMVGPQLIKTVGNAYKAGVKLAYGTDEGVYPHGQNWRDFPLLIQAGVPPIYAIQMATVNAAQLLKRTNDLGSIAPGKYADVVAVPGNPLNDINLMSKVNFVMKGGTIYKQDGKELVVTSTAK